MPKLAQLEILDDIVLQQLATQYNITTVEQLFVQFEQIRKKQQQHVSDLTTTPISIQELELVKQKIVEQLSVVPMRVDAFLCNMWEFASLYSTGSDELNQLLGGGIHSGEILELAGATSTGKTKLCQTACFHALLDSVQNCALYLDTAMSFDAQEFHDMCEKRIALIPECKTSTASIEMRIKIVRLHHITGLFQALYQCMVDLRKKKRSTLRLIVIDSLAAVLGPVMLQLIPDLQKRMLHIFEMLKAISSTFKIAILVTNHTIQSDNNLAIPGMGELWAKVATTRVMFTQQPKSNNIVTAQLLKSTRTSLNKTLFAVTDIGVQDVEQQQQ